MMLSRLREILRDNKESYYEFRESILPMSSRETPTITGSAHAHTFYDPSRRDVEAIFDAHPNGVVGGMGGMAVSSPSFSSTKWYIPADGRAVVQEQLQDTITRLTNMTTRVVRVFIFDPNENLPIESRMMHKSAEKLTDLTDQELFFELPMQDILAKHNELRLRTLDKAQSARFGKDMFLEPVRIVQLKMVVTTVASF